MLSKRLARPIAVGAAALAIGGGAYGVASATAGNSSATATAATTPSSGPTAPHSGGSNARSGPAAGGTVGTIDSVSRSSFTLTTPAEQKVTVTKTSAAKSVTKGENVLVLGTVNGTTIIAGKVIVQASNGSAKASAAGVVPFQQGAPSTAKQAGQIPANYSQGSGTIVSGAAANKATEAALAAYPGGVIDRVVKLSNGEYEVHNIGVNWPHHIFVTRTFKVIGAD
ncbi:MAG TPA: hypothetical protein VKR23_02215 [Gaiellaceae bacterium]|nr:hypothetical protein [Gaiellaceae bacterium]